MLAVFVKEDAQYKSEGDFVMSNYDEGMADRGATTPASVHEILSNAGRSAASPSGGAPAQPDLDPIAAALAASEAELGMTSTNTTATTSAPVTNQTAAAPAQQASAPAASAAPSAGSTNAKPSRQSTVIDLDFLGLNPTPSSPSDAAAPKSEPIKYDAEFFGLKEAAAKPVEPARCVQRL